MNVALRKWFFKNPFGRGNWDTVSKNSPEFFCDVVGVSTEGVETFKVSDSVAVMVYEDLLWEIVLYGDDDPIKTVNEYMFLADLHAENIVRDKRMKMSSQLTLVKPVEEGLE